MATYLKSLGLAEIITVIYGGSCFKVHYQTPLSDDSHASFAFESFLLSFGIIKPVPSSSSSSYHKHASSQRNSTSLFGLDIDVSNNNDNLFFRDVPSLSRSYSSRANYSLKSSLKSSSSINSNSRRHQDTISSSPDDRCILHSQNSSPDARGRRGGGGGGLKGGSMHSTSNQSSDGGTYSDLINAGQGNSNNSNKTTSSMNNRKVVKHGSFIIRKTVKREQSEVPTPTDDNDDDAMDDRLDISRDQRNYISSRNNSFNQSTTTSSSSSSLSLSSNQMSTISYLSSFMDPIASLFGVKLRSTQHTNSRRDCFAMDNEDEEEEVIGNSNNIEHLSVGFDLNPHHSAPNTPRLSVNFKKQLHHFPSFLDSPATAAADGEEESTRQLMMVWDLNTPDRVPDRYRLISILGLFNGERTLSAVVKGLPSSLVNYAIDIVVFLLRYIYVDEEED